MVDHRSIMFSYTSVINSAQQSFTTHSLRFFQKYSQIEVWIWNTAGLTPSGNPSKSVTSDFANICLKFITR